jgi:hypothetical protein
MRSRVQNLSPTKKKLKNKRTLHVLKLCPALVGSLGPFLVALLDHKGHILGASLAEVIIFPHFSTNK